MGIHGPARQSAVKSATRKLDECGRKRRHGGTGGRGGNNWKFYQDEVARLGLAINDLFPGTLLDGVCRGKNVTDVAIEKLTALAAAPPADD